MSEKKAILKGGHNDGEIVSVEDNWPRMIKRHKPLDDNFKALQEEAPPGPASTMELEEYLCTSQWEDGKRIYARGSDIEIPTERKRGNRDE